MNYIKFHLHPSDTINKSIARGTEYCIEKADASGRKRRYLAGISSGMDLDAHSDRMSEDCIKGFIAQAKEKDIPLYVNHGKDFTRDIGILEKSEMLPNKEWETVYRLYDEFDDVPEIDKQEADKVWKQANGLPPYKHKRQFGFSIEGMIPDNAVKQMAGFRIIESVDLDPGVSLVTKPAYTTSVANAVAKALNGQTNTRKDRTQQYIDNIDPQGFSNVVQVPESQEFGNSQEEEPKDIAEKTKKDFLSEMIQSEKEEAALYEQKWEIQGTFDRAVTAILENKRMAPQDKALLLNETFDSYKDKMIQLLSRFNYQLADDIDPESPITTADGSRNQNSLLARNALKAIGNLAKKIKKDNTMNEDLKSVLSDVIASLQMLLQAGASEESPEMEGIEAGENSEMKSLLKTLMALKSKMKKEEDPKEEDKETKALLETLKSLMKAEETDAEVDKEAEGSVDDNKPAEDIILEILEKDPDTAAKAKIIRAALGKTKKSKEVSKTEKLISELVNLSAKNTQEINVIAKGLNTLFEGFGLKAEPVKTSTVAKGVNTSFDQEGLIDQIADMVIKKSGKNIADDRPVHQADVVRKNALGIAQIIAKG